MDAAPVTRIDLFTVPPRAVPRALVRMGTDRRRLRADAPRFWKLLGTGDGRTFDARDADPRRWALLTVWPGADDAVAFADRSPALAGWRRLADEHWWATLCTLRTTGAWSGAQPFREPADQRAQAFGGPADRDRDAGPVVAVTRARLRWSRALRFWRSVAPVTADLDHADGLRLRLGIGEAPIGLQGTLSAWESAAALQAFAYRGAPHREVMRRSTDERWYAEELFARFAVTGHGGTVFGTDPLG